MIWAGPWAQAYIEHQGNCTTEHIAAIFHGAELF